MFLELCIHQVYWGNMQENNNKALKRVVLLVVIVLPSVFYLLMTMGKHNFIYLPNVVVDQGQYVVDRNGKSYPDESNYQINFPKASAIDLASNKEINLDKLPKKVYAVQFYEKDSVGILDASLFFKAQTQLAEKLRGYEAVELLTFYKSAEAKTHYSTLEKKIEKQFSNWTHLQVEPHIFDNLKHQVFIDPVKNENLDDSRLFVILDKKKQMRTGYDKQKEDKYIFAYDAGREYSIKLLVEDLKLLLAEYHKELKSKKTYDE